MLFIMKESSKSDSCKVASCALTRTASEVDYTQCNQCQSDVNADKNIKILFL